MPKCSEVLYRGRTIGIESIYTVIDGKQINIPEKLKDLREKSQRKELFCTCGCGKNMMLVAGDKKLREQHFREWHSEEKYNCTYKQEGALSICSKIVLKCWLEDKLKANDIEDHVPISDVDDTRRKYEFSFLSRSKQLTLNYCRKRENLSDEKLEILDANAKGIHIIHVVDSANADTKGQYPEGLMKVQNRQGYSLLLKVNDRDYFKASMSVVFYAKDLDGLWKELTFTEGMLKDFDIADDGTIWFNGRSLEQLLAEARDVFDSEQLAERTRREEAETQRLEELRKHQEEEAKRHAEWEAEMRRRQDEYDRERAKKAEEAERIRLEQEKEQKEEAERREAERRQRNEDFKKTLSERIEQQETKVYDPDGKRWLKCEICGQIAPEDKFLDFGGVGRINRGKCKDCMKKRKEQAPTQKVDEVSSRANLYDKNSCPICGGKLVERNGRNGAFWGCSNFPKCRFTRNKRK